MAEAASFELLVSELPEGLVLAERYRVIEKIADGAVASVYRAHDTRDDHEVALKIPDPLRSADPVGRLRFMREFEVLSKLNHPNIARSLRLERHGDLDILVLEHVVGETLARRLSRGRFTIPESISIATRIAEALAACHDADVLHRDLKPANVILSPDRGPVILDFGVAWFSSAANLTRTGAVVGTPQYLAPEVFASSLYDARADIYSLGVILFEMLTGRPVYLADNVAELVEAHRREAPPSVANLRPEIPSKLSDIVTRAISPRPEGRFASARELARALVSRRIVAGRELLERLPCGTCGTPLIVDLDFCPGCGVEVGWDLTEGPYAVQLDALPRTQAVQRWLTERYSHALTRSYFGLERRLAQLPVPLIVNASLATAEQLASEARERGAKAQVIRARTILGAKLEVRTATLLEGVAASALHYAAVAGAGALLITMGTPFTMVATLPMVMGVAGAFVARSYVRKPLLRSRPSERRSGVFADRTRSLRESLSSFSTDRGRRVAAAAFARAAPALLQDVEGLSSSAVDAVFLALEKAVESARTVDRQAQYLATLSRSRLSAELIEVGSRAERGDESAFERLSELERQKQALTEASIHHDLAARRALEAMEEITTALASRTTEHDVTRELEA